MENKQIEKLYMRHICEEQVAHLFVVNTGCLIFGLIGYFLMAKLAYNNPYNGRAIFSFYLICVAIVYTYLFIGNFFIKKDNLKGRDVFCIVS